MVKNVVAIALQGTIQQDGKSSPLMVPSPKTLPV